MDLPTLPLNHHLVHVSSWKHPKSRAQDIVQTHPFNQQLEVFLPTLTPGAVGSLSREESFFYSLHLTPRELVEECRAHPETRYYAILKNAPQDGANTVTLFPSGDLLLSLDYDTYTQFGLVGANPSFPPGLKAIKSAHGKTYVITISVLRLDPLTSFGERVFACLDRFGAADFLVCATSATGQAQTVAITHESAQRKRLELNSSVHGFDAIRVPSLQVVAPPTNHEEWDDQRKHIQDTLDWLGAMACRLEGLLQGEAPADEYVSTYTLPYAAELPPTTAATSVRWRGLIPEAFCTKAVEYAKTQVAEKRVPWAAVLVWGFPDALASWWQHGARRDHGFQMEGSNGYTLVCLPGDRYWLIQSIGAQDTTV
ncbi:Aste57867_10381 [Aphanomyces stellatus]|uniref:Aste57867_10381 protein n=1 Tax=Aphanomyces stellatus TaxID=120398 RepID=A0A485KQR0_9STRA|nr:hypothetical protein As57867_010341 [Aphanomyces stellatus]VFT87255.1 Aste57867_10381 [Aphanomyces stellatus]